MIFFLCLIAFLGTLITRKVMAKELAPKTDKILKIVEIVSLILLIIYLVYVVAVLLFVGSMVPTVTTSIF